MAEAGKVGKVLSAVKKAPPEKPRIQMKGNEIVTPGGVTSPPTNAIPPITFTDEARTKLAAPKDSSRWAPGKKTIGGALLAGGAYGVSQLGSEGAQLPPGAPPAARLPIPGEEPAPAEEEMRLSDFEELEAPPINTVDPRTALQDMKNVSEGIKNLQVELQEGGDEQGQALARALGEYKATVEQAQSAYAAERDNLAKREMWESIVNAVGQMAAGIYGLRTGLDMGGTEFRFKDWAKEAQLAQQDLAQKVSTAEKTLNMEMALSELGERRKQNMWQRAVQQSQFNLEKANTLIRMGEARERNLIAIAGLLKDQNQFNAKMSQDRAQFNATMKLKRDELAAEVAANGLTQTTKQKSEQLKVVQDLYKDYHDWMFKAAEAEDKEDDNARDVALSNAAALDHRIAATLGSSPLTYTKEGRWFESDTVTRSTGDVAMDRLQSHQPSGFPRTVRNPNTGKVATVSNAQELAEATAAGFQ